MSAETSSPKPTPPLTPLGTQNPNLGPQQSVSVKEDSYFKQTPVSVQILVRGRNAEEVLASLKAAYDKGSAQLHALGQYNAVEF